MGYHTSTHGQIVEILELLLSSIGTEEESRDAIQNLLIGFKRGCSTSAVKAGLLPLAEANPTTGRLVFLAIGAIQDSSKQKSFMVEALKAQGLM